MSRSSWAVPFDDRADEPSALTRRDFLIRGSAAVAAMSAVPAIPQAPSYDLIIRNGTVYPGREQPGREWDVAVRDRRIVAAGPRLPGRGRMEIDARGLAVSPGFVDIHSHGDGTLAEDPRAESVIRQGVTTIVAGQDGSSTRSVGEWRTRMATLKPAVNVATMIGLGSVRGVVVGQQDRPATPQEMQAMVRLVGQALAEGACGASSGLEYTPGAFASLQELVTLCRPLAARGLPYATHMRNEDDRLLDSIAESIAVARGAKCPLQISHLKTQGPRNWGRLDEAFGAIEQARKGGVDVAFDRYPYIAYQTGLTNLFPVWSRDGGTTAFIARLDSTGLADRIRQETLAKVELIGGWDNVQITSVRADGDRAAEGKRLGAWAQSNGVEPYAMATGLLRRSTGNVGMVGFAMSEDNLDRILSHRLGMVCSDGGAYAVDGPARRGSPHPRGGGSFPRVLGRYVRERKALSLEAALHRMTSYPASRIRLLDRGRIAPGLVADLVVFDPATVNDTATFDQPFQYPTGISLVVVNGAIALRDGERSAEHAGRVATPSPLRRGS